LQLEATGRDPANLSDTGEQEMHRVLRGGACEGQDSYLRSADRYHEKQNMRWRTFGFRPAMSVN
jgi:formylglycine-generating enzyme required for sulfatase activity